MKRLKTGGPLNALNEQSGCNARARTVPIMALLESHPTTSPNTLKRTIEEHSFYECACGIRSTGPVEKFALSLFEAQFQPTAKTWLRAHRRFTYDECLSFHEELFCKAPIRGRYFEYKSRTEVLAALQGRFPEHEWTTRRPTVHEDGDLGVDYVVERKGVPCIGVQVKPHTVLAREDVMHVNRQKHASCSYPVVFHVYDASRAFTDSSLVVDAVQKHLLLEQAGSS